MTVTQADQIRTKLMRYNVNLSALTDDEKASIAGQITDNMSHEDVGRVAYSVTGRKVIVVKHGKVGKVKVRAYDWDNPMSAPRGFKLTLELG